MRHLRKSRPMRKIQFSKVLFWITFGFWFAETWYFGWNLKPQSDTEVICDTISTFGFAMFVFLYMSTICGWVEKKIEQEDIDTNFDLNEMHSNTIK